MEIEDYLTILRRRWGTVLLSVLLLAGLGLGASLVQPPQYTAAARMYFAVKQGSSTADLNQGSDWTERQMTSFAQVATTAAVLQPVIDQLHLHETPATLARRLDVVVPPRSVIMEIKAKAPRAEEAGQLANAVASSLAGAATQLTPELNQAGAGINATVVDPATPPLAPSSPNRLLYTLAGALLGLLLGIALAVLREVLNTRVDPQTDIVDLTGKPLLGEVPLTDGRVKGVAFEADPLGAAAESIRRLRTNLRFVALPDDNRSIVVTSSVQGEGKSTTAVNLALAMADTGARVCLLDADLRRPSVARTLNLDDAVGLTSVLSRQLEIEDVLTRYRSDLSLFVVTAGPLPPNPSELLGSESMHALLQGLTAAFDLVVIDAPPVLPVTDASVLGNEAGGVLVVVRSGVVQKRQVEGTIDALEKAGARILGVTLNGLPPRSSNARYYGTYDQRSSGRRRARRAG